MEIVSKIEGNEIIFHEKNDESKIFELKHLKGTLFSSLKFVYVTNERQIEKKSFFSRFLKKTIKEAEEKLVEISRGKMRVSDDTIEIACFDEKIWRSIQNHNKEFLLKKYVFSPAFPYRFITHIGNVKEIIFY